MKNDTRTDTRTDYRTNIHTDAHRDTKTHAHLSASEGAFTPSSPLLDAATLSRLYDNRALVPEFAVHFDDWAARSALVRASQPCELDVPFGPSAGQRLDVFLPTNDAAAPGSPSGAPVVVFIHGGYWRSLDKHQHSFLAPVFTRQGALVVIVNYDLCPQVSIPDIVAQMVDVLAWVRVHAGRWGGDARRIGLVGHSAGGHLVASVLQQLGQVERESPISGLSVSGVNDLLPLRDVPFLMADVQLTESDALQASPARLPPPAPDRVSLWSVVGGDESSEFLRQHALIRAAWGAEVVPVSEVVPDLNHFSVLEALAQPGHLLNDLALRWLRSW